MDEVALSEEKTDIGKNIAEQFFLLKYRVLLIL
jgi:hypothetical protein